MRAGLLTFAVLVAAASAAPRDRRHYHHAHDKRAPEVVTDIVYATATAPQVIVYVDANGNPVSTAWNGPSAAEPTPNSPSKGDATTPGGYGLPAYATPTETPVANTPAVYSPLPDPSTPVANKPAAYSPPPDPSTPAANTPAAYTPPPSTPSPVEQQPASSTEAAPAPASSSDSAQSGGSESSSEVPLGGQGVAYTPYTADGGLKGQDEINSDIAALDGYSTVRIYDTNSDQINMLIQAAKPKGMKVFVGFTDVANAESEIQTIIDSVSGDWDSIHTVAVGNEAVQSGSMSADAVVDAVNTARSTLRTAGFSGPVITVDTFVMMLSNPQLCENSDYPAANIHPFYDGSTDYQDAAAFVQQQAEKVSSMCGNRSVVVTESGWPWQGIANGAAQPGVEQQATVISGLKSAFPDNIILFTPYDDSWKDGGEFGCEKYWGYFSHAPS